MKGRIVIIAILLAGLIAGIAMYYLQVYAYYEDVAPEDANVQFVSIGTGEAVPVAFENFKGIDAESSPLRYRACYDIVDPDAVNGAYVLYDEAEPLVAPGWFDCFDAEAIGDDLASGAAIAYLGEGNFRYGFDRVVAVYPDGRARAWHQLNACGRAVFGGNPAPEGCPPAPESF